jgi:hypothetical protein
LVISNVSTLEIYTNPSHRPISNCTFSAMVCPHDHSCNVKRRLKRIGWLAAGATLLAGAMLLYVRAHPMVFNESFFSHAYCIKQAASALWMYAEENDGRFPSHPDGYGNALLLLSNVLGNSFSPVTGPGYKPDALEAALRDNTDVPETQCGRVYVQGLTTQANPSIALLFDKRATPGDHCNGLRRMKAPLVREVITVQGVMEIIPEAGWETFASKQMDLLVAEGFTREEARRIYAQIEK